MSCPSACGECRGREAFREERDAGKIRFLSRCLIVSILITTIASINALYKSYELGKAKATAANCLESADAKRP